MSPVVVYLSYAPHAATSCSLGCWTVQNQEGLCLKSCFIQLSLARFLLLPLYSDVIWPKMCLGTSGTAQKATVEIQDLVSPTRRKEVVSMWMALYWLSAGAGTSCEYFRLYLGSVWKSSTNLISFGKLLRPLVITQMFGLVLAWLSTNWFTSVGTDFMCKGSD